MALVVLGPGARDLVRGPGEAEDRAVPGGGAFYGGLGAASVLFGDFGGPGGPGGSGAGGGEEGRAEDGPGAAPGPPGGRFPPEGTAPPPLSPRDLRVYRSLALSSFLPRLLCLLKCRRGDRALFADLAGRAERVCGDGPWRGEGVPPPGVWLTRPCHVHWCDAGVTTATRNTYRRNPLTGSLARAETVRAQGEPFALGDVAPALSAFFPPLEGPPGGRAGFAPGPGSIVCLLTPLFAGDVGLEFVDALARELRRYSGDVRLALDLQGVLRAGRGGAGGGGRGGAPDAAENRAESGPRPGPGPKTGASTEASPEVPVALRCPPDISDLLRRLIYLKGGSDELAAVYAALSGRSFEAGSEEALAGCLGLLLGALGGGPGRCVLYTDSRCCALCAEREGAGPETRVFPYGARERDPDCRTGRGDTAISVFLAALLRGLSPPGAAALAAAAVSAKMQHAGGLRPSDLRGLWRAPAAPGPRPGPRGAGKMPPQSPQFLHCPEVVKFENLSQIAVVGETVYLGGQVGMALDGSVPPTIEAQTRQAFENVRKLLEHAGSGLDRVASLNVFLSTKLSAPEEEAFNVVYREVFSDPARRPCRCCMRAELQDDFKLEVVNVVACK